VGRPAHRRLPFDVDDAAAAHGHLGGDARGYAERVITGVHDRQAIDLSDPAAAGVDHQNALADHLAYFFLHQIQPVTAFAERPVHMSGLHAGRFFLRGEIMGLAHQVCDIGKAGGNLVLPAGQAHTVFRNLGHGGAFKGQQLFVNDQPGDELRVAVQVGRIPHHGGIEIRTDLEDLLKLVVRLIEQVIEVIVADHNHLDVYSDRLRLHGRGGEEKRHIVADDLCGAVFKHPLQRVPHARFLQHVHRMQNQVPAVGQQQRAGADFGEIGPPLAIDVRHTLDGAEQLGKGGRVLKDHRRAFFIRIVHDHIDAIFEKGILTRGAFFGRLLLGLAPGFEQVQIFQQSVQHRIKIAVQFFTGEFQPNLIERFLDHRPNDLSIQGRQAVALFLLQFLTGFEHLGQLFVQLHILLLDLRHLLRSDDARLNQFVERFQRRRLILDQRQHIRLGVGAHLHLHNRKLFLAGALLKLFDHLCLFLIERFRQRLPPFPDLFAFHQLRNGGAQMIDKDLHLFTKSGAPPRRHDQGDGHVRPFKIVDITDVVRLFLLKARVLEQIFDGGGAAGAAGAGHIDVIAGIIHLQSKGDGAYRPVLTQNGGKDGKVLGGFKTQIRLGALPTQPVDRHGFMFLFHGFLIV